jgi:hypothetical protein
MASRSAWSGSKCSSRDPKMPTVPTEVYEEGKCPFTHPNALLGSKNLKLRGMFVSVARIFLLLRASSQYPRINRAPRGSSKLSLESNGRKCWLLECCSFIVFPILLVFIWEFITSVVCFTHNLNIIFMHFTRLLSPFLLGALSCRLLFLPLLLCSLITRVNVCVHTS